MTPDEIHIDLETFSPVELKTCGVHKYARHENFEIMLATVGYYDQDGRRVYEQYEPTNGSPLPPHVIRWVKSPEVVKKAHNAMFERVCLSQWLGEQLDPRQWRCVMVTAGFGGLPLKLATVAKALALDTQKLAGTALINYFAKPCKPTKANGGRVRNRPADAPDKWAEYKKYNLVDVEVEWNVDEALEDGGVRVPAIEWEYYALDQRINDRGVAVDLQLANRGAVMASKVKEQLKAEIQAITGVDNAGSVAQLRAWLDGQGVETEILNRETLEAMLRIMPPSAARDVLELREQASRTSTDKYKAAVACAESDGRARGLFAFNGAYRTGRFAGRRVQVQNLKRIYFAKTDAQLTKARDMVRGNNLPLLTLLHDTPIDILSQLIRTVFVGDVGRSIIAADYSAIEARVLAWLAGEEWKLEVFRTHGKIYEATAARMFGVPFDSITKDSDYRQKGKVGELAFGYGGALGAVDKMGFLKDGTLTAAEVKVMVKRWRRENPAIVELWAAVETMAIRAVSIRGVTHRTHGLEFYANDSWLFVRLPSGRELAYYSPRLATNKWGRSELRYMGENDKGQWAQISTYGGKLTENITQAIARDIMCDAQYRVDEEGIDIVLHVHDEIAAEDLDFEADNTLERMCKIMAVAPKWAAGLPLNAEGFVSKYYKK